MCKTDVHVHFTLFEANISQLFWQQIQYHMLHKAESSIKSTINTTEGIKESFSADLPSIKLMTEL